ncbi:hypothetical protein ACNUIT_33435 [Pseudomonas aeruginosa]|uniref:hypothetical protein n=1 Tax=Pseudomonas aeruginosa TaxID=287 RepID=UPI003AAE5724
MLARVILEPSWQSGEGQQEVLTLRLQEILAAIRVIVLTSDSLQTELAHAPVETSELRLALLEFCEQAAACLERYPPDCAGRSTRRGVDAYHDTLDEELVQTPS